MTRMGERRSKLKTVVSVLLVAAMLLGVGLPGVSLLAVFADDSGRIRSAQWNDIVIAVPETVYMTPQSNFNTTTTSVKYYVNNTINSSGTFSVDTVTDNTSTATKGKFYIYSQYISSITSVSVSGASLSGLSASKSGNLFSDTDFTMTLSSGLSSSQTRTLEWTITCSMTDGTTATFYAWTIAYAPYLSPIVAAGEQENDRGSNHWCGALGYISGIHDITNNGNYFPKSSFLPLISVSQGGGKQNSKDFLEDSTSINLPTKGCYHYDYRPSGPGSGDVVMEAQEVTPWGKLTVDTSRYSNLKQVPNVTLGLSITDTDSADRAYAYISNFTGTTAVNQDGNGDPTSGGHYEKGSYGNKAYWYNNTGTIIWGGKDNQVTSSGNTAYLKTGVLWNCAVTDGTSKYYSKAAARSYQGGDNSICTLICRMNITGINKSSWRTAINTAQKYGFQSGWFTNASDFNTWKTYLKAVYEAVGNPTNSTAPNTTNLSNQTNTLRTEYNTAENKAQVNDLAYIKELSSTGVFSNEWKVIAVPGVTNPVETEAIRAGSSLTLKSTTYTGFTYKGNLLLANQKAVDFTFTNANPATGLGLINTDADVVYKHITQTQITNGEHRRTFYYQGNDVTVTVNPNGGSWNGSTANSTITGSYKTVWNLVQPTRTGYIFDGWTHTVGTDSTYTESATTDSEGYKTFTATTFTFGQSAATLKAKWKPITYQVAFDGNGATDGSMSNQTFNYGTAQNLTVNAFTKSSYTVTYQNNNGAADTTDTVYDNFAGWLGSPRLISDFGTEYSKDHTNGDPNNNHDYQEIKQYTIAPPFAAGEVFHLEFDAKGTGRLTNYFYGTTNYLQIASAVNGAGESSTSTDGNITHALTGSYQHFTVTWTLSNNGNANVEKYVLFRVFGGNSATVKNIEFWKETGSVSYTDGQSVNNLCSTRGAIYQMRAQWTPGSVTLPSPTYANHVLEGWYADSACTTLVGAAGASYTPSADITLYAKWERPAKDDSYVLDYGLPVQLNVIDNDLPGATLKSVSASGAGYTAVKNGNAVTFTPTAVLNEAVTFTYTATYNNADYTANVTVIPANNVYYEESFFSFAVAQDSSLTWKDAGADFTGMFQDGTRPGDEESPVYGFDDAYDTTSEATYSLGHAKYVEVSAANKGGATATFTFSGTGFDFYSVTNNQSGLAFVDVYKIENGQETNVESTLINTYFGYKYGRLYLKDGKVSLDSSGTPIYYTSETGSGTFFIEGEQRGTTTPTNEGYAYGWVAGSSEVNGVYQVPVISWHSTTGYGTYKVVVEPRWSARQNMTGGSSYKFYVDAVRVYDPIDPSSISGAAYDAYAADDELNAGYQRVRDLLKSSFGDTNGNGTAGVVLLETGNAECTPADYQDVGPKNEVYLNPGQAIAFHLTTSSATAPAKVSVGLRMASGTTGEATVYGNGSKALEVKGTTELYRDISSVMSGNWKDSDGVKTTTSPIIIRNTGSGVISITQLKWSYAAAVPAGGRMLSFSFAPQDLVTASAVMRQESAQTVTPDAPTASQTPQPAAGSSRRMITIQALLEQIFNRFFESLRLAFLKK
ncbi:MAG: InlB B-repeat-containing protein [Clostridia bacterium]|nr:InlB B-repeat-containing protein [Clostridia bacterium]